MTVGRRRGTAGAVLLSLAMLAACRSGGGTETGADGASATSTSERPSPDEAPAGPELLVGTCFDAPGPPPAAALRRVEIRLADCLAPHLYEVFARVEHPAEPGAAYPGDELLFGFATEACLEGFAAFVGISYEMSVLDLVPVELGDAAWEGGERVLACALYAADLEPLTGSMRGSQR